MSDYWIKRGKSFVYAWKGIISLFSNEPNARIHLIVAILTITMGGICKLSQSEWTAIIICIGIVFSAEAFNTAIEKLCDKVSPQIDPFIKISKDVAAGAVLILAIAAVITGLIIFIPHLAELF